jgi:hypothetical protein
VRRIVWRVIVVACLAAALAVGALWLRSYRVNDLIMLRTPRTPPRGASWSAISNLGGIKLGYQEDDIPTANGFHHQEHEPTPWTLAQNFWHRRGFAYNDVKGFVVQGYTIDYTTVLFPHWFAMLVCVLVPIGRAVALLARRRGARRAPAA